MVKRSELSSLGPIVSEPTRQRRSQRYQLRSTSRAGKRTSETARKATNEPRQRKAGRGGARTTRATRRPTSAGPASLLSHSRSSPKTVSPVAVYTQEESEQRSASTSARQEYASRSIATQTSPIRTADAACQTGMPYDSRQATSVQRGSHTDVERETGRLFRLTSSHASENPAQAFRSSKLHTRQSSATQMPPSTRHFSVPSVHSQPTGRACHPSDSLRERNIRPKLRGRHQEYIQMTMGMDLPGEEAFEWQRVIRL